MDFSTARLKTNADQPLADLAVTFRNVAAGVLRIAATAIVEGVVGGFFAGLYVLNSRLSCNFRGLSFDHLAMLIFIRLAMGPND